MNTCKKGSTFQNVEGLQMDKSGRVFSVLIGMSLLLNQDLGPTAIATTARRITERKEIEEEKAKVDKRDFFKYVTQ
ncbi:MAG: hypothetical protein ABIH76_09225 [Candidatus Bathyarchaeota archaeon]